MKKLICLFSLLFAAGQLAAHLHPTNGSWDLTAEYLYFRPSVDDTYFVIPVDSNGFPQGTRENNDFGFHSGFRVGGGYGFCGCNREVQIYYTRLNAKTKKTVTGTSLGATTGSAIFIFEALDPFLGTAESSLNFFYQRVDGLFAGQVFCCCGSNLYLLGGVEYASARLNENINYKIAGAPVTNTVLQKERTWGVGPQLGIDYDYNLCSFSTCRCPGALSVTARASTSLLVSKSRESLNTTGNNVLNVNDHHSWRIVPALHARVGLNYTCSFNCWAAALEIGYEIDSYFRGFSRISFPDTNAFSYSVNDYFNFDVQGLYVSATVGF